MKNKKSTIGFILLLAGSLVLTNCTKNKTNPAPEPDTEVGTTSEAIMTQMILSDLHEICGQVCEANSFLLGYHDGTPLTTTQGSVTINSSNAVVFADLFNEFFTVTFNNTVGKDGHVRNGMLKFDYSPTTIAAVDHYRQAGFKCIVTSTGYAVDNYTLQINSMQINNTTPIGFPTVAPFFPSAYKISWQQIANVDLMTTNGTATMTTKFNGTINKVLENTNNTSIPMPSGYPTNYTVYPTPYNSALNLAKQYVSYTGSGTGTLIDGTTYELAIKSAVTRNMVSSPEAFASFNGAIISPERHPFLTGTMSFKPGNKSERIIDFGPSGDVVDYNAKVTIDGISYSLDVK